MTDPVSPTTPGFRELGLAEPVLAALDAIGYEVPTSIQAETIPHLLAGRDLVGQAQTGTGKTAAFALPMLSRLSLDPEKVDPQVLVLVPTRELAIQVAEAFHKYAAKLPGFHVLPIYGGTAYGSQLHQLRRGVQVVVGTPGRLKDHLERGRLRLDSLTGLVIDEADEMLRMGFIDEVESILEKTPPTRQIALFSATMPESIRRIAKTYLQNPIEIKVRATTATVTTTRQRYWMVSGLHKLDALTRILEGEEIDGMIVFVRTKSATEILAEKLEARGFSCAPMSGDIPQNMREQTVEKLRRGQLDILVATDVAARGLDVQRISHVVNFDIPNDIESYVHRIGRTGRAGRKGEAILFVAPREKRLLHAIERATNQRIEPMNLPTTESINDIRIARFKQRITDTLAEEDLGVFASMIEDYMQEHNVPAEEVAAALAKLAQGDTPLLLEKDWLGAEDQAGRGGRDRGESFDRGTREGRDARDPRENRDSRRGPEGPVSFELYRIEVGRVHGVKPGQVVAAIANEAGVDGRHIGRIAIYETYSTVELPGGMPNDVLTDLQRTKVCGQRIRITRMGEAQVQNVKPWERPAGGPAAKVAPPAHKPAAPRDDARAHPAHRHDDDDDAESVDALLDAEDAEDEAVIAAEVLEAVADEEVRSGAPRAGVANDSDEDDEDAEDLEAAEADDEDDEDLEADTATGRGSREPSPKDLAEVRQLRAAVQALDLDDGEDDGDDDDTVKENERAIPRPPRPAAHGEPKGKPTKSLPPHGKKGKAPHHAGKKFGDRPGADSRGARSFGDRPAAAPPKPHKPAGKGGKFAQEGGDLERGKLAAKRALQRMMSSGGATGAFSKSGKPKSGLKKGDFRKGGKPGRKF